MAWVRLEDTFVDHPKVVDIGPKGAWLHVCALCYCNRHLTDGTISTAAVRLLSDGKNTLKLAEKLVEVGLWEHIPGGYQIHDYLHYQPSKAEVTERRAVRAEAGRLGGIRSGESRRSKHEANASRLLEAKTNPDPTQPDPRTYIPNNDDDSTTPNPPPSSSFESIELLASAIAAHLANQRTDITNRRAWINRTAAGLIHERKPDLQRIITRGYTLATAIELLTSDPTPAPKPKPPDPDPNCEHCEGTGWHNTGNNTYAPCPCRATLAPVTPIHPKPEAS